MLKSKTTTSITNTISDKNILSISDSRINKCQITKTI